MKQRSVVQVLLLTIVTFGIYGIVWQVKTKEEMVNLGADIPTAWLLIIPIANIYWLWKYSVGVEKVTNEKMSSIVALLLLWFLGVIGMMIIQSEFNKLATNNGTGMQQTPIAQVNESIPQAPVDSESMPQAQETSNQNIAENNPPSPSSTSSGESSS